MSSARDLFLNVDSVEVIAELGINHEGVIRVAETVIEQLKASGAAAIKLQSFTPERYVSTSDAARFQRLKDFAAFSGASALP